MTECGLENEYRLHARGQVPWHSPWYFCKSGRRGGTGRQMALPRGPTPGSATPDLPPATHNTSRLAAASGRLVTGGASCSDRQGLVAGVCGSSDPCRPEDGCPSLPRYGSYPAQKRPVSAFDTGHSRESPQSYPHRASVVSEPPTVAVRYGYHPSPEVHTDAPPGKRAPRRASWAPANVCTTQPWKKKTTAVRIDASF
jgi:hypothetical protein